MGNFIIKEQYYAELESFHQNHEKIKMYFEDNFELKDKYLQKANIFKGQIPDLKVPKESMIGNLLGKKNNDSDHTEHDYENSINLYESMKLIVETGEGPREQVPSMGCSIKWK